MTMLDRSGVYRLSAQITEAANKYFKVEPGHVLESVVRACGFRTEAAFVTHVKQKTDWRSADFDHSKFVARLSELDGNPDTAEAVGVLVQGVTIQIEIEKYSTARLRGGGWTDPVYDISVVVQGASQRIMALQPEFFLPQFHNHDREIFRVDSAANLRVDPYPYEVTRKGLAQRELLSAMVDAGKWQGGIFVFDPAHQQDDRRCLRSVRAAMVRAVLPAFTAGVRCRIFKPDRYDRGAWRIELSIAPAVQDFMGDDFTFEIPELPKRHVISEKGFGIVPNVGRIADGVWRADVYSNGIAEDDNPTTINDIRAKLTAAVYDRLAEAGWRFTEPAVMNLG